MSPDEVVVFDANEGTPLMVEKRLEARLEVNWKNLLALGQEKLVGVNRIKTHQ